jgi:hypothetical protein
VRAIVLRDLETDDVSIEAERPLDVLDAQINAGDPAD